MANKPSKLGKLRRSKNARLILIAALLVVLGIMYFMFEKFRIWILGLMVVLLGAFGMEMTDNDFDVQTLMETGSFSESRVNVTENGTWLIGECEKRDNFNCDNFAYQEEAQRLFDDCGGVDNDIHGLDRDKDGIVCEALRKKNDEDETRSIREILGLGGDDEVTEVEAETEASVDAVLAE
jgi:hypothetical protein